MIFSILFTSIYLLTWIKFQQNQFAERDYNVVVRHKEYSKNWHFWKGANQLLFFILIGIIFSPGIALVNSVFYWIFFDGLLNKIVLGKSFFYVGTTSYIDIKIQKLTELINKLPVIKINSNKVSAFLKLSLLFLFVFFFI